MSRMVPVARCSANADFTSVPKATTSVDCDCASAASSCTTRKLVEAPKERCATELTKQQAAIYFLQSKRLLTLGALCGCNLFEKRFWRRILNWSAGD